MELQFQKQMLPYCRCVMREVQNTELTQEIRLPDGMPDIGRVLSCWGQVVVRSKQWQTDQAAVTGGVLVWTLYAPEDGTAPRSVEEWIPFQLSWELPPLQREGVLRVAPLLRFANARGISARKMLVRVGVGAMGEILCMEEAEIYAPEQLPEDVELLRRTYPVRLPREYPEKNFFVDEEPSIPTPEPPDKILAYLVTTQLHEEKVNADKALFRGVLALHLLYRGQDGRVQSWDTSFPFSQFVQLENTYSPQAQLNVQIVVTSLELDRKEQGQIRMKCGLTAQCVVDDQTLVDLVQDAYSPNRSVETTIMPLQVPAILEEKQDALAVQQTINGADGEVVDLLFWPDFPRCTRTETGVEAKMSGVFQILSYGEENTLRAGTAHWEGQMDLPAANDCRIDLQLAQNYPVEGRSGSGEMNLQTKLDLHLLTTAQRGIPMVTSLEIGEVRERDPATPSLILCRAEEEDLWDLAKRCHSTVAAITAANKLQDQPIGEQMLLIPVL